MNFLVIVKSSRLSIFPIFFNSSVTIEYPTMPDEEVNPNYIQNQM